ncbi:calcium-binding protein [uncultured Tateyamaria sp.]|uniref:calcium-binding protein n=1 Tax=uncultured Tateyamaria sp. TaxID=455651 RepID=UPI002616CA04|nr:calcium-binding protein [uncultured Tateyamaria sp.]
MPIALPALAITSARGRFDPATLNGATYNGFTYTIDFNPVLEIEQFSTQARNFVFFEDNEGIFFNDGIVRDLISGAGDADVVIVNDGIIGESDRTDPTILLTGTGQRVVSNEGSIIGSIQLGTGSDVVHTAGLIDGDVNTSGGDDYVVVADFFRDGIAFEGEITGRLNTGSGDDVVVNGGVIGDINLGSGDDLYLGLAGEGDIADGGRIIAGDGNDTVRGSSSDELIFGGAGRDELEGNDGDDRLAGGGNKDTLRGGEGDDSLIGGGGSDFLAGGNGDDFLNGNSGRDDLVGGRGDDTMHGGSGDDVFFFTRQSGADVISDFQDGDLIRLVQVGVDDGFGGTVDLVTFDAVNAFTSYADGNAVIDLDGLYTSLGLDYLVGGNEEDSITLLNVAADSLTEDDFIL